eukprot:m.161466 g.161466  ORF g.161466 m.161466 type:complete len:181 (-) comp53040_c0_seq34:1679-2221(-)
MVVCVEVCSAVPGQAPVSILSLHSSAEIADGETRVRVSGVVFRRLISELTFHVLAARRPTLDSSETTSMEAANGVFRLARGQPYAEARPFVWRRLGNLVVGFVCDGLENLVMADLQLQTVIKALAAMHPTALENPLELLQKPEEVTAVLHFHVPNGLILFAPQNLVAQLSKEVEVMLSSK